MLRNGRVKRTLPKLLLGLTLPLAACAATTGSGAVDHASISRMCSAWPNTTWAEADTDATIADAKANNAARAAFCRSE